MDLSYCYNKWLLDLVIYPASLLQFAKAEAAERKQKSVFGWWACFFPLAVVSTFTALYLSPSLLYVKTVLYISTIWWHFGTISYCKVRRDWNSVALLASHGLLQIKTPSIYFYWNYQNYDWSKLRRLNAFTLTWPSQQFPIFKVEYVLFSLRQNLIYWYHLHIQSVSRWCI